MLKVIEESPSRLVLRDQRPTAGIIAAVFTGFSVFTVLAVAYQGIDLLIIRADRDLIGMRLVGMALFLAFGIGFTLIGVMAYQHFTKGVTLVLDKAREIMHLQKVNIFRVTQREDPIYGISRIEVQTDERMRVYALYVVLRTGEKIPVAAMSSVDEADMERAVNAIRAFLRTL